MKTGSAKDLSLTTIFAVLYAVAVIALTPISFNILQVRVADALLPLAIIFGWPAILGLATGTVAANFFGGLGIIDVIGGSAANLLATFLAWRIGRTKLRGRWICGVVVEVLTVTLIVGGYLSYIFDIPLATGFFGILMGSVVAIAILGYLLLKVLSKPSIINPLRSLGIKIYLENQEIDKA